jgi:hypothetical protein
MATITAKGQPTLLRVNEVGDVFGPPNDNIQAEVILKLDTQKGKAFGLKLRNDNSRPVRQGMLDLLRDAFNHGWTVNIDYEIEPNKTKGRIIRVWLTKEKSGGPFVNPPVFG